MAVSGGEMEMGGGEMDLGEMIMEMGGQGQGGGKCDGKGKGKDKGKEKGKGKQRLAAGEPCYFGKIKEFDVERNRGYIVCDEVTNMAAKDVYIHEKVLAQSGASVGDTIAFFLHWSASSGQPQASAPVVRLAAAEGFALKGVYKPGGEGKGHGFLMCDVTKDFFGRDIYVNTEAAAKLEPGTTVSFNTYLNRDKLPNLASEPIPCAMCDPDWEPTTGDITVTRTDPSIVSGAKGGTNNGKAGGKDAGYGKDAFKGGCGKGSSSWGGKDGWGDSGWDGYGEKGKGKDMWSMMANMMQSWGGKGDWSGGKGDAWGGDAWGGKGGKDDAWGGKGGKDAMFSGKGYDAGQGGKGGKDDAWGGYLQKAREMLAGGKGGKDDGWGGGGCSGSWGGDFKGKSKDKGKGDGKGKEAGPPPQPTGETFLGVIKSYSEKNSYGFIACEEVVAAYGGADVFFSGRYLDGNAVGDAIEFDIGLNRNGQPQAIAIRAAGAPGNKRQRLM